MSYPVILNLSGHAGMVAAASGRDKSKFLAGFRTPEARCWVHAGTVS